MRKPIPQEVTDAFEALAKKLGARSLHIIPVRVCDNCEDEDEEAIPFHEEDSTGKMWHHLCWDCYVKLFKGGNEDEL